MNRDGAQTSLWQTIPDFQPSNAASARRYDVIIVGGGITGITTAHELQNSGKNVLVIESHTLCYGTTGGTTAHLNTFFDTTYDQIKSKFGKEAIHLVAGATTKALELYQKNIEQYSIDCGFGVYDGYVYALDEKQVEQLDKMYEVSKEAYVDVSYTDRIPVPVPFLKAIVYREQAAIHPTKYVMALAKAFEEKGGTIIQNCKVDDVSEANEGVVIGTAQGSFEANYLIWATHIPPGINLLHFRCAPYRSYALAVKLRGDQYPDGLAYDLYDPYHYFRTQEVDGQKYLIAGGDDHKTGHQTNTEACFNSLESYVRTYFDVEEVSYRWSSQYFEPADGLAYIGLLPGSEGNILVATGYSGNGMTYSHIAAPLLRDLILKRENPLAELFSPARIKPVAGFANFVKENADVVAQFVQKRISPEKIEGLSDLAKGEGKLVKYDGDNLAIYKGEEGEIFALNPVCTHAKCVVDWNSAEKSWIAPVTVHVIPSPEKYSQAPPAVHSNAYHWSKKYILTRDKITPSAQMKQKIH